MKETRTRIAPSPTGAPHIGTAYIALFNRAFAKKHGGSFILRIEDTDQARCSPESEAAILEALRWIGLPWDEGPDKGGPFGPYRQSERTGIYREHCAALVESGRAYPCFCSAERLRRLRAEQAGQKDAKQGYDGLCASIPPAEARARAEAGEPHVIRMRVPEEGECVFHDRLRGEIRIPWAMVDHQVLLKADGFPTYHLANVVDDRLMGISHVIRGEEWISSTPKHLLLYDAFGWEAPEFAHLPLLRNPDKSKLSKRKNPTGILYYKSAGFLPEALLNYLGLMAYSMPDGRETFSFDEMADSFDLDRVSLGGPVFDPVKLANFNGRYIRALDSRRLADRLREWAINGETIERIAALAQPRMNRLSDFMPVSGFMFADRPEYDPQTLIPTNMDGPRVARLLRIAQWEMEKQPGWSRDEIRAVFDRMAERENFKLKEMLHPFYVALSGAAVSLPIFDSMHILGRDMSVRRIQYAIEALDQAGFPIKGKELKALREIHEKTYSSGEPERQ